VIKHGPGKHPFLKYLIPCLYFSESFENLENLGGVKLKHLLEIQNINENWQNFLSFFKREGEMSNRFFRLPNRVLSRYAALVTGASRLPLPRPREHPSRLPPRLISVCADAPSPSPDAARGIAVGLSFGTHWETFNGTERQTFPAQRCVKTLLLLSRRHRTGWVAGANIQSTS
jgi:hypothetical protein